jgi:CHAP domain
MKGYFMGKISKKKAFSCWSSGNLWSQHATVAAITLFAVSALAAHAAKADNVQGGQQAVQDEQLYILSEEIELELHELNKAMSEQDRVDLELKLTPVKLKRPSEPSNEPTQAELKASEMPKAGEKNKAKAPYVEVVKEAKGQVGYHEKGDNCTKYGNWYGSHMNCVDWCDIFVSWVFGHADHLKAVGGKHSFVPAHYDWFRKHKRFHLRGEKAAGPCRGCVIFFDLNRNKSVDHIGIVTSYDNTHVYTVEGNRTNQVKRARYERSSDLIYGYGYPDWKR